MSSEQINLNNSEHRIVRRHGPVFTLNDSTLGSGTPRRIYNFITQSFIDVSLPVSTASLSTGLKASLVKVDEDIDEGTPYGSAKGDLQTVCH